MTMFDFHITRRRLAAAALAAPLALAACGSSGTTVDAGGPSASEPLPPATVQTEGMSSSGVLPAPAGSMSSDDASGTSMLRRAESFEFVIGDIGDLPAEAMGWAFLPSDPPADETVAALAAALGVDPAHIVRDGEEPGEFGGAGAGQLWVGSDAQQSWGFTSYNVELRSVESCPPVDPALDESSDTPTLEAPDCTDAISPPDNVPTDDEARGLVRDLLTRMGDDPFAYHLEVVGDEWAASVIAEPILDGVRSQFGMSFTFGANGNLDYASGYFADPVQVGPYPLVDLDTALARLNAQWTAPGDDVEVTTVTLSAPEISFIVGWSPDDDGTYLYPSFNFAGDNGGVFGVVAVTDEFLPDDGDTIGVPETLPAEPQVDEDPEPASPPATIGESTDPGEPTG